MFTYVSYKLWLRTKLTYRNPATLLKKTPKKCILLSCLLDFKKMWTKNYWLFIALSLLLLLGCEQKNQPQKLRIAFSQCIGSDAWRETMLKEMKRELSFHPHIEFLYADAEGNNNKQIEQIRAFLKQDIDLLIVSPNEAEPLTPIVDSVFRQNIPVIVTDRKTASGIYNAYVGADNYAIGTLAAQYLTNQLNNGQRIGMITGLPGTSASVEREKGFRDGLKVSTTLELSVRRSGDWLQSVAEKEIKQNLDAFRDIEALFAFNDQMAIGAINALKKTGVNPNIKIIGVDALPGEGNGLQQILAGQLTASLLYPTGGAESIKTALAILNKAPYERENLLSTSIIDISNAALMNLQYEKIDNQQRDIDRQQELLVDQQRIYNDQKTTLNILIISLVLAVIFGGIAIIALKSNWEQNKHLEQKNNEITQQQHQLIQMSNQIKASSDARSNFFTKISHEFKTPLTLIITPLEDLLTKKDLPSSIASQLERMKRNAEKLLTLINELIDLQRFSQEKVYLKASPHQIDRFIIQTIQAFKPLSTKKRIAISYTNHTGIRTLWFDPGLMEKVFDNLLSNALKFTEKHGKIEIHTELNKFGDHILIRIVDNGRGIKREHIDHIFDPFYQGIKSNEGSGIGLALAKEIITMHHGQITVSSKEEEGTAFTIRLPVGSEHLSDEEKQQASEENNPQHINKLPILENDNEERGEDLVIYGGHTYSILIVDDHYDVRDLLTQKLKETYNIYTASDATHAFDIAINKVPDLIISDVMMPGKSGLDLLHELKNDARTSFIPVVLLSAVGSEENKIAGAQGMAEAYITKPFRFERLLAIVESLIKSREHLKNRYKSEIEVSETSSEKMLSDIDRSFLNNFSAIIESNLTNTKLSVEGVAEQMNLSRIQLYRRVKSLLDCGVNDYILTRRLKKAKHLIIEGYNINEIAEKVGFSSSTYFATAFKKAYGVAPSAYKKGLGGK